jgi:hypothetical protein
MSTATTIKPIGTNAELCDLVRDQLQRHGLRLRPNESIETLLTDLQAAGLSLTVQHHTLTGKVSDLTADIPGAFESFAAKNTDKFFPRDVSSGVRSRDELDRRGKAQFISRHGLAAFEALPRTAADAGPIELDPATMTRQQYLKLPLKVKSECIAAWGADQISRIMARAK